MSRSYRKGWDDYFLDLADQVATRSTCPRLHVGALLVLQRKVVATGYNGSRPGLPHCEDAGCLLVEGHCVRTLHGERNAYYQFKDLMLTFGVDPIRELVLLQGATMYLTHQPCPICRAILEDAGIRSFLWRHG
jgi:dCMP deaminase